MPASQFMEAIMNRRQFTQLAGAAAAGVALQQEAHALPQQQTGTVITDAEVDRSMKAAMTPGRKRQIASCRTLE